MKIGVISDVHGNHTALTAVLDDMPPVDALVSLGDVVGYGPHPREVVSRVRDEARVSLFGNHESFLTYPEMCSGNVGAYKGIKHAREELTDDQFEWATNRPYRDVVDDSLYIVHGHPDPETPFRYVYDSNVTDTIPYFREKGVSLLAFGHSHIQFKQDLSKFDDRAGVAFNPGSVGQPRDKDPRAAYAVADTDTGTVSLHRVEYDVESVVEDIAAAGLPSVSGQRLRNGTYPKNKRRR